MSTCRSLVAGRHASVRISAGLLTCLLTLTLATLPRSHSGQHHVARAKAVVGVTASDIQQLVTRADQHAVTTAASGSGTERGVRMTGSDPLVLVDAGGAEAPRVRGPPGRAA